MLLLFACTVPDDQPEDLQELYDLGLNQYLGVVSPSETTAIGGDTHYAFAVEDGPKCLFGDPFRAATREESSNNLLIYLQGGGACWSDLCLAFSTAQSGIPSLTKTHKFTPAAKMGYINNISQVILCYTFMY